MSNIESLEDKIRKNIASFYSDPYEEIKYGEDGYIPEIKFLFPGLPVNRNKHTWNGPLHLGDYLYGPKTFFKKSIVTHILKNDHDKFMVFSEDISSEKIGKITPTGRTGPYVEDYSLVVANKINVDKVNNNIRTLEIGEDADIARYIAFFIDKKKKRELDPLSLFSFPKDNMGIDELEDFFDRANEINDKIVLTREQYNNPLTSRRGIYEKLKDTKITPDKDPQEIADDINNFVVNNLYQFKPGGNYNRLFNSPIVLEEGDYYEEIKELLEGQQMSPQEARELSLNGKGRTITEDFISKRYILPSGDKVSQDVDINIAEAYFSEAVNVLKGMLLGERGTLKDDPVLKQYSEEGEKIHQKAEKAFRNGHKEKGEELVSLYRERQELVQAYMRNTKKEIAEDLGLVKLSDTDLSVEKFLFDDEYTKSSSEEIITLREGLSQFSQEHLRKSRTTQTIDTIVEGLKVNTDDVSEAEIRMKEWDKNPFEKPTYRDLKCCLFMGKKARPRLLREISDPNTFYLETSIGSKKAMVIGKKIDTDEYGTVALVNSVEAGSNIMKKKSVANAVNSMIQEYSAQIGADTVVYNSEPGNTAPNQFLETLNMEKTEVNYINESENWLETTFPSRHYVTKVS